MQDLYDSIARGEYPEWKLFIQTMDLAVSAAPKMLLRFVCCCMQL